MRLDLFIDILIDSLNRKIAGETDGGKVFDLYNTLEIVEDAKEEFVEKHGWYTGP